MLSIHLRFDNRRNINTIKKIGEFNGEAEVIEMNQGRTVNYGGAHLFLCGG